MNKHATSQAKGYYQIVLGDEAPSQNQGENQPGLAIRVVEAVGRPCSNSWKLVDSSLGETEKTARTNMGQSLSASTSPMWIHVVHAALPCSWKASDCAQGAETQDVKDEQPAGGPAHLPI